MSLFDNEIDIEEWKIPTLKKIGRNYDEITLTNDADKEIEEKQIIDGLIRIKNIDRIKTLKIQYNSKLNDLRLIKAFPALESLYVFSYNIKTFNGIEMFSKGQFLLIDTEKNKKRDIKGIENTKIKKIVLTYAREEDINTISKCKTLDTLLIHNSPNIDFKKFKTVPINTIQMWAGKIECINEISSIKTIESLTLCRHKKIVNFLGNNSGVKWLLIQYCQQLDFKTIDTFIDLEHITIVGQKNQIKLSTFTGLEKIKSITFLNCKFLIDVRNFSKSLKNIEKLFISNLKKSEAKELSRINENVTVANNSFTFKNNELIKDSRNATPRIIIK